MTIKANYDRPFPRVTVNYGEGADWDTFASFIKLTTDVAYQVKTTSGACFRAVLESYSTEDPIPATFRLWNNEGKPYADYNGPRITISLTEVVELAVL